MSKYALDISVEGNAEAKLNSIADRLGKVSSQAKMMQEAAQKAGGSVDEMASSTKTTAIDSLANRIENAAAKFEAAAARIRAASESFVRDIINDSADFEDAQAEMRFAFGKDWENVYEQTKKDAADLTFTFKEVSSLASSMGRMHINPFGGVEESQQQFLARNGQMIRALAVLQDTADSVGKSAGDVVISVRNALSGSWKSLQDRFDIPRDKIQKWKGEIEKLKEPQEKYNKLVSELALMFGGAGFEKADNWHKNIEQLPDLLEQIRAAAGMAGLREMTMAVKDLITALAELSKDPTAMKALSDGFMVFADTFAYGTRRVADFVVWVNKMLVQFPWLPRVAAALGLVAFAMATVVGGLLTAAVTIGSAIAAFSALGLSVEVLATGALVITPILLAMAAAATAVGLAGKATADTLQEKWGPQVTMFEKINAALKGLTEMIRSYNGTTAEMSAETAAEVEKAGMMGFVTKVMDVYHRFNIMWESFTDRLDEISEDVGPPIIALFEEMKDLFYELSDALGLTDAATQASSSSTQDWADVGRDVANVLIRITNALVGTIRVGVGLARVAIQFFHLKEIVELVGTALEKVGKLLDKIGLSKLNPFSFENNQGLTRFFDEKKGRGSLFHREERFAGAGDPFARKGRMAGSKYRDDEGNFDPTKIASEFGFTPEQMEGKSKSEILAELMKGGYLNAGDLKRMARGRDPLARAKTGPDWASTYEAAAGRVDMLPAAAADPDTTRAQATTANALDRIQSGIKQAEMDSLLREIRDAIKADRQAVFEVDGQKFMTINQSAKTSVAGY